MEMIAFAKEIVSYLQASNIPKEQAEDVVQDVFIKMLETDAVIPAEKMRAWMYRVSIRKYIDKYRRDRHYMEILNREFFKSENLLIVEKKAYSLLNEAVEELPQNEQVILDLYYFQGFSIAEIVNIIRCSQSKIKVQLMRSRKKLKQLLKEKGYSNGNIWNHSKKK